VAAFWHHAECVLSAINSHLSAQAIRLVKAVSRPSVCLSHRQLDTARIVTGFMLDGARVFLGKKLEWPTGITRRS